MKKIFILFAILLIPAICLAANTYKFTGGKAIEISAIDSDYFITKHFKAASYPNGVKVKYVIFVPGASGNKMVLRDGADTGPELINTGAVSDTESRIIYMDSVVKPYLKFSDGTYSAGSKIIILVE